MTERQLVGQVIWKTLCLRKGGLEEICVSCGLSVRSYPSVVPGFLGCQSFHVSWAKINPISGLGSISSFYAVSLDSCVPLEQVSHPVCFECVNKNVWLFNKHVFKDESNATDKPLWVPYNNVIETWGFTQVFVAVCVCLMLRACDS